MIEHWLFFCFSFSSILGDAFSKFSGTPFSTKDKDITDTQCSTTYESAWWFSNCSGPLLNGRYPSENTDNSSVSSMHWMTTGGESYTVMKSEMKIRRIWRTFWQHYDIKKVFVQNSVLYAVNKSSIIFVTEIIKRCILDAFKMEALFPENA